MLESWASTHEHCKYVIVQYYQQQQQYNYAFITKLCSKYKKEKQNEKKHREQADNQTAKQIYKPKGK